MGIRVGLITVLLFVGSVPPGAVGAAAVGTTTDRTPTIGPVATENAADSSPAFRWPLDPQPAVLTEFAPPATRYGSGHRGVDLAGTEGVPIRAAGSGVVIFAGTLVDRGVVSIEHAGGLRTTYEPVTAVVIKGARVTAGQQIGSLETGHPRCLPLSCLHWGAKIGEDYLDPLSLLRPLQVRLKPWDGLADTPP